MPKSSKRATKASAKPEHVEKESAKFAAVVAAFARDRKLAPIAQDYLARKHEPARAFGSNALKVNGKIFAMCVKAKLVVKLPKARVDELVTSGKGSYFDPGHGRLMKQWVSVEAARLSWTELALEAHDYVGSARQ